MRNLLANSPTVIAGLSARRSPSFDEIIDLVPQKLERPSLKLGPMVVASKKSSP
jgi:hypothetical protein